MQNIIKMDRITKGIRKARAIDKKIIKKKREGGYEVFEENKIIQKEL